MQNSIRDVDYLPFLHHISPRMSKSFENTSFEVVAYNRTSVYEGITSPAHAHYGKIWKLQLHSKITRKKMSKLFSCDYLTICGNVARGERNQEKNDGF